jgi:hypothetical protein
MFKRLAIFVGAVVMGLPLTGCCIRPHCECPCYCQALKRDSRQIMDVIDVHFLNYDRHDPFQCDPCIGD